MSSFQAKIGWKRQRKIENKKSRSVSFLLDAEQKIKKKKAKKFKNTIMASFHAKIGWKRQRKGEKKNCSSVLFPPDAKQNIPKKLQKN